MMGSTTTTNTTIKKNNNKIKKNKTKNAGGSASSTTGATTSGNGTTTGSPALSRNSAPATSTRKITGTTTATNNNTGSTSFSATTSNTTGTPSNQELMVIIQLLERRLKEAEKQIGLDSNFCLLPWRSIGKKQQRSISQQELEEQILLDGGGKTFKLPKDVYSVLATWNWKSYPFWVSMAVWGIQMLLLVVLAVDVIYRNLQNGLENWLNLPVNVEWEVRLAQFLAVIVAMVMQDDLRVGIEGFSKGLPDRFKGREQFQGITKKQWRMSYGFRFLQGVLSMFASFALVMQADRVIDIFLDFLGIAFISDLDDRFFALAELGYLGKANLRCTQEISRAEFYQKKHPTGKKYSISWFKTSRHAQACVITVLMVGGFIWCSIFQLTGKYTNDTFQVEFGDETVPYLGLFNGCYNNADDNRNSFFQRNVKFNGTGRFFYTPVSKSTGGTFAFCADKNKIWTSKDYPRGRWTFYDSNSDGGDECEDYIAKSDITRNFDIIEAGKLKWYTKKNEPLEFLKLSKVEQCTPSQVSRDACKRLELHWTVEELQWTVDESRSRFYDPILPPEDVDPWDHTLSHTIYVGTPNLEVVLFTGSRWVITDATSLSNSSNHNIMNASDIEDMFFKNEGKLFDVTKQAKGWIKFISEEVGSAGDGGTPRGLRWYYPRYEEETTSSSYNFPSADLSRPVGDIFICACDYKLNRCWPGHFQWPGHFPIAPHAITINVRTDSWPDETSLKWSKRTESGLWQVLKIENPSDRNKIYSFTNEVQTETLYKLQVFDSAEDGIDDGWLTITNSIPSPNFKEGTLLWEASGSALKHSLVVLLWVDANGHAQVVELDLSDNDLTGIPSPLIEMMMTSTPVDLLKNGLLTLPTEISLLTDMTEINLSGMNLTGEIPSEIGLMTRLTSLSLARNDLTGTIPIELGYLTALRVLYLFENHLAGPIPKEIGRLTALDVLGLYSNNLNGPIPKELGELEELNYLLLSENHLSGRIPSELGLLTALHELDLSRNDLNGPIPSELGILTALTDFEQLGVPLF